MANYMSKMSDHIAVNIFIRVLHVGGHNSKVWRHPHALLIFQDDEDEETENGKEMSDEDFEEEEESSEEEKVT